MRGRLYNSIMSDLFKKFNTLVRAQLESLIEDDLRLPVGRRRDRDARGPRSKRDLQLLRDQINTALDREESLQTELDALHQDASDFDQQANDALQRGDEPAARQSIARLRQTEQQITMAEADLTNHRHMTASLMDQVNILESQLAAEQAQAAPPPTPSEPAPTENQATVESAAAEAPPQPEVVKVPIVVELTDEAEETQDVSQIVQPSEEPPAPPSTTPPSDDDDLDSRRARLARRDSHKEE